MAIKGKWRVYYNMRSDYPFVYSIDDGDAAHEGNFTAVTVNGHAVMRYSEEGYIQPRCWLEVEGEMIIDGTTAVIWGAIHARQRQPA